MLNEHADTVAVLNEEADTVAVLNAAVDKVLDVSSKGVLFARAESAWLYHCSEPATETPTRQFKLNMLIQVQSGLKLKWI